MSTAILLITGNREKWENIFNAKLVFNKLTDEHVLRILFLQKIKKSRNLQDNIKIYLDNYDLEDFDIADKLYSLLRYKASDYNIQILDIEDGYNIDEITSYNKKIEEFRKK